MQALEALDDPSSGRKIFCAVTKGDTGPLQSSIPHLFCGCLLVNYGAAPAQKETPPPFGPAIEVDASNEQAQSQLNNV